MTSSGTLESDLAFFVYQDCPAARSTVTAGPLAAGPQFVVVVFIYLVLFSSHCRAVVVGGVRPWSVVVMCSVFQFFCFVLLLKVHGLGLRWGTSGCGLRPGARQHPRTAAPCEPGQRVQCTCETGRPNEPERVSGTSVLPNDFRL